MNRFNCKVSDKQGKIITLVRTAATREGVLTELQREGYYPIAIREEGRRGKTGGKRKYSGEAVREFTAAFSMLLESGLTVKDSLDVLTTIISGGDARYLVEEIKKGLEEGLSFHQCVKNLGAGVPPIYAGMVKIGEATGDLDMIFKRLHRYLTQRKEMRDKLISSLIYPVIVLFLAVFSVLIIITIITPRVSEMFSQLGNTAPASVLGVLQFSQIAFRGLLLFLGVLIAAVVLVHLRAKRNKRFAEALDRIKLKFPVIGSFIFENEMLTILFTLEALTESAIPVEEALRESTTSTSNKALVAALLRMRDKLLLGKGLAQAMEEEEIIPEKVARWVGIGERTGKVQQVFSQLRFFYEKELEKKVSRFMSLIEPALIIFVGLIVFGIVIFVIVPIFSTFGSLLE